MDFEIIFTGLTASAAIIGLWFGLFQYREAQKWKRLEFAASVIDRISTDPDLRLAITFLDWKKRDLMIPERYVDTNREERIMHHSHQRMAAAFSLQNRENIPETGDLELKEEEYTLENIVYVDTFDRFFEHIEQVESFINMGLVKHKDMYATQYLANRVWQLHFEEKPIFREYLLHYRFEGVLSFITKRTLRQKLFPVNDHLQKMT